MPPVARAACARRCAAYPLPHEPPILHKAVVGERGGDLRHAFGTAITVAVLATLALGSRELALKLGGRSGAWANGVWTWCALGGSTLILLFGALLFAASLGPARPF